MQIIIDRYVRRYIWMSVAVNIFRVRNEATRGSHKGVSGCAFIERALINPRCCGFKSQVPEGGYHA